MGGFAPGSGGRIEVTGSRTVAAVIIPPDFQTMANESLAASFADSAAREAERFATAREIRVTEGSAPALDETIYLDDDDRRLFGETEFIGSRVLTPAERASRGKWVTVTVDASTYVAGSDIFLVATSSPLIVGEETVQRDGTVRFTISVPLEALGAGAHRFRVVGIRDLGGVTVGEDGTIAISDATAAEIAKFDTGTTATARISGEGAGGGSQELVRYIPLREPTPWYWLLVPIVAGLLLAWLRRYRRLMRHRLTTVERERLRPTWLSRRLHTRLPIGLALGALSGLVPTWVGWVGMFFDLGFVGLLSILLVPLAIGLVRIRREEGEGDEPTGLEQARAWWARYRANRVFLPISLPRRRR